MTEKDNEPQGRVPILQPELGRANDGLPLLPAAQVGTNHDTIGSQQPNKGQDNDPGSMDSAAIDGSTSPKAPATSRGQRWGGHGRLNGAGGNHGGRGSIGEGVKRKASSDVPGPKMKKPRTAFPPPPPREMSKRCSFDSLISICSSILILIQRRIHCESYANSLVKIREPRK